VPCPEAPAEAPIAIAKLPCPERPVDISPMAMLLFLRDE